MRKSPLIALVVPAVTLAAAAPAHAKAGLEAMTPSGEVVAGRPAPVNVMLIRGPRAARRRDTAPPQAGVRVRLAVVQADTGVQRRFLSPPPAPRR